MKTIFVSILLTVTLAVSPTLAARLIPFQAKLTTAAGAPVADGVYSITFSIYDQPLGGVAIASPEVQSVSVVNGAVNVVVGSITDLSGLSFTQTRYLGIRVGTGQEMVPRHELVPSFHARTAESSLEATHATNADLATQATHATSADSATNSTHATNADSATLATEAGRVTATHVTSKSSAYTVTLQDDVILGDTTGGPWALTLFSAAGPSAGRVLNIKKISNDGNALTIMPSASQQIDGLTSITLVGRNDFVQIVSDGANWQKIGGVVSRMRAQIALSVSQPLVPTGTATRVRFNNVLYNSGNMANVTDPSYPRIDIKQSGVYLVGCNIQWEGNTSLGSRAVFVKVGGSTPDTGQTICLSSAKAADGNFASGSYCEALVQFSAGDSVSAVIYQNSGGDVNVVPANFATSLWVQQLDRND